MDDVPQCFWLRALNVECGTRRATARVVVTEEDVRVREGVGEGDGPIAAVFYAIDAALGGDVVLEYLSIRAATPGRDAAGEVVLRRSAGARSRGAARRRTWSTHRRARSRPPAICGVFDRNDDCGFRERT